MDKPDYGEVTLDGMDSRLKVLEHQFGGLIKDMLKFKLQNEKRERSLESLYIHITRIEDRVTYLLMQHGLGYMVDKREPKVAVDDGDPE